jgi:hypothetical protein
VSLKARIRGLEVKVEWLERWGELRKVDQALRYRQSVKKIVDYLEANPTAAARLGVADLVGTLPGRDTASLADRIARSRAAVRTSTGPPKPSLPGSPSPGFLPREPPPPEAPSEEPVTAPPPKTEAWTHDPPEHLQIEKVTWRMRGPQDDLGDDEEEEAEYYDPLRHA